MGEHCGLGSLCYDVTSKDHTTNQLFTSLKHKTQIKEQKGVKH